MIEILTLFRTVLGLCLQLGRASGRKLIQPVLTAACVTGVYTGVHVMQERGVVTGLRAAFLDNEFSRSERRRSEERAILQSELRQFVTANRLTEQLLRAMLARASGASRVQLDVIHNGVTGLTGTGLLRYDLTDSIARPGRAAGNAVTNQPLSDWIDFLPSLLADKCSFHHVDALRSAAIQARLQALGAIATLVCPAGDVQGRVVGAIFVIWDTNDPVPDAVSLRALMAEGQHLGGQIAAILDLRGPPPWPDEALSGR
ncbi:MAG TPA: hypothetical protein VHO91_10030 [Rhodopila sp.]|nr:hypothetical protein [Rhodopila sp.]